MTVTEIVPSGEPVVDEGLLPEQDPQAPEGTPPEPEFDQLDLEAYGAHVVPIKVDGEDQYVAVAEAAQGYMRQADYTRKTQVAAEALRLAAHLEQDPERTLRALAGAYEIDLGGTPAGIPGGQDPPEPVDPEEARWQEVQQFMQTSQMREVQTQIERELADLHTQFGEFDEGPLIQHAVDRKALSLRDAYASLNFDAVYTQTDTAKRKAAVDAQALASKRTAPQLATATNSGAAVAGAASPSMTVAEAFAAAKQQLGIDSIEGLAH
jgi:hypothetical protein